MYVVVFSGCIHSSYHVFSTKAQLKKAAKAYERAISCYQNDHNWDFREESLKQPAALSVSGERRGDWKVEHVYVGWGYSDEGVSALNEFVNSL